MNKKIIFFSLTVLITTVFSLFANDPPEVVIIGPEFHEQQYFVEELNIIANDLGIKIKYEPVADTETFIIDNPNSSSSIAIIPNPQGVVNLAERKLIYSLDDVLVDNNSIFNLYPNHLSSIVSHEDSIYGGWTRLLEGTKKIADNGTSPWCANSESAASTGWVQTNWMEDVLLTKYGPKVYDEWSKLKINASNVKIFLSIKHIEDFIFYDNHIYNGPGSITDKEFRNLPKVLLDDTTECFMSWSGHYFRYYIPEDYQYLKDFAVTNVPKINFENSVVGIGDNIVLTKDNELSKKVISKILSKNFGEIWSSYQDTEFISANQNFNKQIINNELTKYEYSIVHDALQKDLFRYDASEIMARRIGSNLLWELFREYVREGPQNLVKLLNQLDKEI